MTITLTHVLWALALGAISAVSLPLGSIVGLKVRFSKSYIAVFAAFGAGALIAALSVELVAPTAIEIVESEERRAYLNFIALLVGGVLGGILFVGLDFIVNQQGGYLRKPSTTASHIAMSRRKSIRQLSKSLRTIEPFNALPPEADESIGKLLQAKNFQTGQTVVGEDQPPNAIILLEGEVEVTIQGKSEQNYGPGTLLGVLTLFVPELVKLGKVQARTDLNCLVLELAEIRQLRKLYPEFDESCRQLAAMRMDQLKSHLADRLSGAVEWAHASASALRRGDELPQLSIPDREDKHEGSPLAVWLGILLDGIPESLVIGAGLFSLLAASDSVESLRFVQIIPFTLIAGLFLSNLPEALSSSANMLSAGWSPHRIFMMWFALMVTTSVGAGLGFLLAGVLTETWMVFAEGIAAGAMLTMIAAAMIPEAAAHGRPNSVGLATLGGFLAAISFKLFE